MVKALMGVLLLIKISLEECLQGCLKCNERDECLFCDFKNSFKIQGISCQAVTITNCQQIDVSGNCLLCKDKFYLDKSTNKCVEMKSADLDSNCAVYASATECQACISGFYVFEGKCTAVKVPVANCTLSDSTNPALCLACNAGFILTPDRTGCVKVTVVDNCSAYSVASCATCKAGYLLNYNKYIEDIYRLSTTDTQFNLLTKMNYDITKYVDQGSFATCSKIIVENCKVVADVDKCTTCNDGYYLDAKFQCQLYPLEGIANCVIYLNALTCIECASGYFPENPLTCTAITVQPNCVSYSTTTKTTVCLACSNDYYLNSDKKCIQRVQSKEILRCKTPDPFADVCLTCNTDNITTDDKLACLTAIAMCQTYDASNKSSQQMVCLQCKNGFYFDSTSNKCQTGTIDNCDIYQTKANQCVTCKNKYYLSGSVCVPHSAMPNCSTYDFSTPSKCTGCDSNYFLFEPQNACVQAKVLEKCIQNADINTCASCQDGYKLNGSKLCELITTPTFCLQVNGSSCTKCMSGYYIENGSCVLPTEIFSSNCLINNADGIIDKSLLACSYCKSTSLPMNYKSSYICLNQNRFDQSKIIANCLLYKIDGSGNYACTKCIETMVLKTDGTCGDACNSNEVLKVMEVFNYVTPGSGSTDFDNFAVTRTRVCVNGASFPTGCTHIYPDIFSHSTRTASEASYVCRKCTTGYQKYIITNQITNTEDPDKSIFPTSPVAAFPGIGCKSNPTRGGSTSALTDYCEYYVEFVTGHWGCIKCQFGFSGVVEINASISSTIGYIRECQKITTCDTSVTSIYDGFIKDKTEITKYQTVLGSLFSCHVCSTAGAIPHLAISITSGSFPKLGKFSVKTSGATFGANSGGQAVDCYTTVASSFTISPDANYSTVTNCGLGIINIGSAMNAAEATSPTPTAGKVGVFCYACKPGYKATRIATDSMAPLMVYSCAQISNCQSSTWFNGCSNCNLGYVYKYDPTTKTVAYDTCEQFSDPNCFAVDASGATKVCKYCNIGFNLNADKLCEAILAVQCTDTNFLFSQVFSVLYDNDQHGTGLYLMPKGPGCTKCSTNNLGLFVSSDTYYCTESTYLQNGSWASGSKLINNCANYIMNPTNTAFICKVCKEGYIPTDAGNCVEKNTVPNCSQAKSSQQCSQCNSGYAVVNGSCVKKSIANCITYDESPNATQLACKVCDTNYYPTPTECKIGNVVNCKVLTNENTCTECLPSFVLISIPQGKTYCYPIPTNFNCSSPDIPSFIQKKYKCNTCSSGYVISTNTDDFPKTVCFNFTSIGNCSEYNYAPLIQDSSFTCKTCNNGFYLNGTVCVARNVSLRECVAYKPDKDECAQCMSGNFVNSDGKSCIPYPTGVKGCRIYKSLTECVACKENMFYNKTRCDAIPANNTISKCIYYADLTTCTLCQSGFAVSEGRCVASQATNCYTYESKTACGSCYDRFGFKDENGVRSCVAVEDKNCKIYQMFYPFKCLTCNPEFYSLNGVCTAVTTAIDNCLEYDSPTTCRKCNEGSALHFNKTLCSKSLNVVTLFDSNCSELKWMNTPVCSKCKPGYFFVNSTCTQCTNNTLESGCYNCNPKNQTSCHMCNNGYFQSKDSKCTSYALVANTTNITNSTTNNTNNTASAGIHTMFIILVLGLLFIEVLK